MDTSSSPPATGPATPPGNAPNPRAASASVPGPAVSAEPEEGGGDRGASAIGSFVAVGDSFTEGMSDALPNGSYRGWADLLATRLAARQDGFRYANLAVRGKLISQIAEEQVGPAAEMGADLVTLVGGLNDVLRPRCDTERVCALLEESAERLAAGGGQLVLMRSPGRSGPVLERYRDRIERLFRSVDEVAARHGALVVDLFSSTALADSRMWADDRLHLTAEGHRRVAEAVWQRLGLPAESDWRAGLPPATPQSWTIRRRADLRFAREHLLPWVGRRLTGRSSGDGRSPKRPELTPLTCEELP